MSVVIRHTAGAYQWTCTVIVGFGRSKRPCRHMAVADTEENAHKQYEAHKRQIHG